MIESQEGENMLNIEKYIAKRKIEDNIDEFNLEFRSQNIKIFVDYIFEYFNTYLNSFETFRPPCKVSNLKIKKYRDQLQEFDPEVQKWLIGIYCDYGKQINKSIRTILKKTDFFILYDCKSEFTQIADLCYSQLIKKLPFINGQYELLTQFIKNCHKIDNSKKSYTEIPFLTKNFSIWLNETLSKHQVNLQTFSFNWVSNFFDQKYRNSSSDFEYDYKKNNNLFNINSLYEELMHKTFIYGKKQELEILLMFHWLHNIESDPHYWDEYLEKVLPLLEK